MSEPRDVMRGVVAISLPATSCSEIARAADSMSRRAPGLGLELGWVAPASYHVCVAYLGWMRPEACLAVDDVMRNVAGDFAPFSLSLRGMHAFAEGPAAQGLAIGVAPSLELERLRSQLAGRLGELGFATLGLGRPDVVVARSKKAGELGPLCVTHADTSYGTIPVQTLNLLNTDVITGGYDYEVVKQRILGTPWKLAQCQTVPVQTNMYDAALSTDDGWMPGQRHNDPTN